ncbi:hypothetical protein ACFY3J_01390 [Streptomyces sp. NPDC001231]|uniref:hypothetical protein n=1 Tax=Streptomyces sp. NPDC001231 TaxID=3364549 RepID=UPI0036CD9D0E
MELEKRGVGERSPEGCLVVAIRMPVRIVVLVLVVPVRMAWDALVVGGRLLRDTVLRPLGRALVWLGRVLVVVPLVGAYRWVLTPIGHTLVWLARRAGDMLAWVYARVLAPIGRAAEWVLRRVGLVLAAVGAAVFAGAARLVRWLLVAPGKWCWTWILTPAGRALARCARGLWWVLAAVAAGVGAVLYWTCRVLLVLPALALWRWVLTPAGRGLAWCGRALWRWVLVPVGRALAVVGREVADALGHAWRVAGRISLAVGRFLGAVLRRLVVEPVRWAYRRVLTPVGHAVRDAVLRPAARVARQVGRGTRQAFAAARDIARQARADLRRALLGEPRPVARREPVVAETRTLETRTGREVSPPTRG